MAKRIIIHVDAFGGSKVEAKGYTGGECQIATSPFEQHYTKVERERQAVGECGDGRDFGERVFGG